MCMNNDARGLLIQAEQTRERGDFKRSLELLSDAIVAIQEERKDEKMVRTCLPGTCLPPFI